MHGFDDFCLAADGSEQQEVGVGAVVSAPNTPAQVQAVEARHQPIADDGVETWLVEKDAPRLLAIGGHETPMAKLGHETGHLAAHRLAVVDAQDGQLQRSEVHFVSTARR